MPIQTACGYVTKNSNRKLRMLITSLDEQTWTAFRNKEARLKASYERSTVIITGLIVFSIYPVGHFVPCHTTGY